MANPISGLLDGLNPMTNMMRAMQSGNPLDMISQSDPRMQQVNEFISKCGGDPQQAFYQLARERGVDPAGILNQVKSTFGLK